MCVRVVLVSFVSYVDVVGVWLCAYVSVRVCVEVSWGRISRRRDLLWDPEQKT